MSFDLGSLLSGVLGAFIVFVLTVLWTEIREARQRTRARIGYARLLDAELEANGRALSNLRENNDMTWEDLTRALLDRPPSDEAWKEVREPLAPLIKGEDFKALDAYYRLLRVLLELKEYSQNRTDWGVWGVSSDLEDDTPRLRGKLSRYADPPSRAKWLGF